MVVVYSPVRVAVECRRWSVGSPTSVCNTSMGIKDFGHVDAGLVDELSKLRDLAHLLECEYLILLVSIDG